MRGGASKYKSTVPQYGGSSDNWLEKMMVAQAMLGQKKDIESKAELEKVSQQTSQAPSSIEGLIKGVGSNPKLGTTVKVGPTGASIDVPLNEKYTVDEARSLGMSDSISRGIGYILEKQKDPNFRGNFQRATMRFLNPNPGNIGPISTTIGGKDAGILKDYLKDLSDRILRLRSGAQINEQEMRRMTGLLPTWEDVSDNDPTYERMNRKLATFVKEMNDLKRRVAMGRMVDDTGKTVIYDPNEWQESIEKMATISVPINDPINKIPTKREAPKGAYGWSKSKKAWVDANGNVMA